MSDALDDILDNGGAGEQLDETAQVLSSSRPLPAPSFRGELGRLVRAARIMGPIRHLRLKALALAVAGALLLGAAGAGVAGNGPLAPSPTARGTSHAAGAPRP